MERLEAQGPSQGPRVIARRTGWRIARPASGSRSQGSRAPAAVAMISGHRDPRMLFRYTHPKAELIAEKPG
jgi:hypothetical protein